MRRVFVMTGSALMLLTVALGPAAWAAPAIPAGLAPRQRVTIHSLNEQITSAKNAVIGWQAWLQDWSARIDRAEHNLARLQMSEGATPQQLAAAHAHADAVVGSRAAVTAYRQLTGWEAQLQTLRAQRTAIARGVVLPPVLDGSPVTYEQWAGQLLTRLSDPVCEENVTALVTWQSSESTTARFNPLATTHDEPGATSFNSIGVRNFVSLSQGLDAAVSTLRDGSPAYGYGLILTSLAACAPADQTAAAINASSWCAGCAFGGYVTNLLPTVRANYSGYAARTIAS